MVFSRRSLTLNNAIEADARDRHWRCRFER